MLIKSDIANRFHLIVGTFFLLFLVNCPRELSSMQSAAVPQGGVALGLFASHPEYNYDTLLKEIRWHHGKRLLLAVPFYLDTVISDQMRLLPGFSPSIGNVARTLKQAQRYGFEITLMPMLRLQHRDKGDWRGVLEPRAGLDVFFKHYEEAIWPLVRLSTEFKVKRFVIGSELLSLEHDRQSWARLIKRVRQVFSGRISYAANWDHYRGPSFWDLVDEMGVSSYFELSLKANKGTRMGQAEHQWRQFIGEAASFSRTIDKPLMLMEVGYPSQVTAALFPWDESRHAAIDLSLQADLYGAFCRAVDEQRSHVQGFFFWNWFGFGGAEDDSYTPRGKPAAHIMKDCLERF